MTEVLVIDYGVGNLFNVGRAFEAVGASVTFSRGADDVARAERVVLPGVGAFGDGIQALRSGGYDSALAHHAAAGKPLLCICLGMQMLFTESEEFGRHDGLQLIPGDVRRLPALAADGSAIRIPHVGWNELQFTDAGRSDPILKNVKDGTPFYFVHSYAATNCSLNDTLLGTAPYGGYNITAVVRRELTWGFQFHPERSGSAGLSLLASFLRM